MLKGMSIAFFVASVSRILCTRDRGIKHNVFARCWEGDRFDAWRKLRHS